MKKLSLTQKFIISFVVFAVINTLAFVILGGNLYRQNMIDQYNEEAYQLARTMKATVKDDYLKSFAQTARSAYLGELSQEEIETFTSDVPYQMISTAADAMREQFGAVHIMLIGMRTDGADEYLKDPYNTRSPVFSIIDSIADNDKVAFGDEVIIPPVFMKTIKTSFESGKEPVEKMIGKSTLGYCIYAFVPVSSEDGSETIGIVSVIDMQTVIVRIRKFVILSLITSLLVTFVCIIIFLRYQMKNVINPIRMVTREAYRFTDDQLRKDKEDIELSEVLRTVKTGDELQTLSESVYDLQDGIVGYASTIKRVTAEKERISAELDLAANIQSGILPKEFPAFPDRKEFDIYASMTPAKEVGGDFYDFFMTDDDHLALVIADVSGKGVPAALFMMIAKALIKTSAQMGMSPGEVLSRVNDQMVERNDSMMFVTVWMAIITVSTGEGIAVNAAHEHPVIRRAGGQYELVDYEHSLAVGMMEDTDFEEHTFHLNHGDSLFVYTDGVAEAFNADDEQFGTVRLCEALNRQPDLLPKETCEYVKEAIDVFVGDAEQFDDITMLAVKMS